MTLRKEICDVYSQWTAFSGTRSGCPLKSRKDVYPLIQLPNYDSILLGKKEISKEEFNEWHKTNSILIQTRQPILSMGWATKLINLYLKTMVYVGQFGRLGLASYIHPPIDNGLWDGITQKFKNDFDIINKTHFKTKIKEIKTYDEYLLIFEGIEIISKKLNCLPIEVEQLWAGAKFD